MSIVHEVYTLDRSNHRLHRRFKVDGVPGYYTQERCQADQSGDFDEIDVLPENLDGYITCRHDFPDLHQPAEQEA